MSCLQSKILLRKALPDPSLPQTLGPSTVPNWELIKDRPRARLNKTPDVVTLVLSYLPPKDLSRASKTCQQWAFHTYKLVQTNPFDLSKLHPLLSVIGPRELAHCGLLGVPKPLLDQRTVIPLVLHLLETLRVEGNAGGTLLTLSAGFTLNVLTELMAAFKEANGETGAAAKFSYIGPEVVRALGDDPIEGGTVFITNSVLEGSRHKSVEEQKRLLEEKGCEMPDTLTAATLVIAIYMVSQRFLFGSNAARGMTYTRCSDSNEVNNYRVIVGGFAPAGLHVNSYDLDHDIIGSGALRKFLRPLVLGDLALGNGH